MTFRKLMGAVPAAPWQSTVNLLLSVIAPVPARSSALLFFQSKTIPTVSRTIYAPGRFYRSHGANQKTDQSKWKEVEMGS